MATDCVLFVVTVPNDENNEKHGQKTENDAPPSVYPKLKSYLAEKINDEPVWMCSIDQKILQVTFRVELGIESDRVLQDLKQLDISKTNGCRVCVVPATVVASVGAYSEIPFDNTSTTSNPSNSNTLNISQGTYADATLKDRIYKRINVSNFKKSVRARLMVHQVVAGIRATTALSFDFVILLSLASMIAAFGLLESSSVNITASMLVSPLMNPLMGIVFGLSVREHSLWRRGVRNEVIGLTLCLLWGFVIGLCTTHSETNWGSSPSFPTPEMKNRGDIRRLWVGILVAVPSGAGVALSVLGGNTGSLVGVAISASLLPPAVNCGLLWGYAAIAHIASGGIWGYVSEQSSAQDNVRYFQFQHRLYPNSPIFNCSKSADNEYMPFYSCNISIEAAILGSCSFLLTVVNILCIIIMALIVLRIKEVVPLNQDNKDIQRFFHHDVKVARDYNRTIHENDHISGLNFAKSKRGTTINQKSVSVIDHWRELASRNKNEHHQSTPSIRTSSINYAATVTNMNILQTYVKDFDLDVFSETDRELLKPESQEKVSCLVKNLLDMYEEDPAVFVDFCRFQPYGAKTSAKNEHFTFYDQLIELLPPKWYNMFERERRHRSDRTQSGRQRSNSLSDLASPFKNRYRLNQSLNEQHQRSRLIRLPEKELNTNHNHHSSTHVNEQAIESDEIRQHKIQQAPSQ